MLQTECNGSQAVVLEQHVHLGTPGSPCKRTHFSYSELSSLHGYQATDRFLGLLVHTLAQSVFQGSRQKSHGMSLALHQSYQALASCGVMHHMTHWHAMLS